MSRKLDNAKSFGRSAALATGFVALLAAAGAAAAASQETYAVPAPQPRKKVLVTLKTIRRPYSMDDQPEPIEFSYAYDEDLEPKEYATMAYAESADIIKSASIFLDWTMLVKVVEDGMTVSATRYDVSRYGTVRQTR